MNKKFITLFLASITLVVTTISIPQALAKNSSCEGGYGANECFTNIVVDKTVQDPKNLKYVNDLGSNDERFNPGQKIKFQIKVTNTGNLTLKEIEVKDTLPPYLELIKGFGKYDPNTREITLNFEELEGGKSKTLNLEAKVIDIKKIPSNQSIICTVNHVLARSKGEMDEDNSGFCIQTKVFKVMAPPSVKETPSTGPEMLALIGLIPAGLSGIYLRRKIISN